MTTTCYLGLGSNIETASSSRFDFLFSAVRQLAQREDINVVRASKVYETKPVGYETQENFYNAAIEISTSLSAHELLRVCLDVIEKRAGRIRTIEDGPRTLDVDILLFGQDEIADENLIVPHPKMKKRAFVMVPLSEIAPDVVGDLSQYQFDDDLNKITKLDENFDELIDSYRER